MTSLTTRLGALAGSLAVLGACAPKEEAPPAPPPSPNVVTVHASDFSYQLPDSIPSGFTTFKLVNDGPNLHHMIVVRLDSGKTFADATEAMKKGGMPPAWMVPVGGPNAPDPKAEANATLDMKAGDYVVLCEVDIPGGVPHAAKGMVRPLKVYAASGPTAPAPTATTTIALADYSFNISQELTAGKHTIAVTTSPGQPHEVEIVRFNPGKTMDDLGKDMGMLMAGKPLPGPMSAVAIGGVAPAVEGTTQYFDVELTSGSYAILCFLPDQKDRKPHLEHGMVKLFTIP